MSDTTVAGNLSVTGLITTQRVVVPSGIPAVDLATRTLQEYKADPLSWWVHDAPSTHLPSTAANDDLGVVSPTGGFGTAPLALNAGDLKNAGATTRYAVRSFILPPNYVAGSDVKLQVHAGMGTTVASASATVDFSAYLSDAEDGIGSDLVTTGATSINSTTFADYTFNLTSTALLPGDQIDVRVAVAVNDSATATAVDAILGSVALLCDTRGG